MKLQKREQEKDEKSIRMMIKKKASIKCAY